MKKSHEIAKNLLKDKIEIIRSDPVYKKFGFEETLPKIIDECNYTFAHPGKFKK